MPARKSNVSIVSNGAGDETNVEYGAKSDKYGVTIDDLTLPKSMIARLAKGVLPPNTQIHKDALLALHKSATVFVSYIASNANELAQAGGKKTIAPADVFASIKDAELEAFVPRLEAELKKYNEMQCDKRNSYRHRVKQEKAAATQAGNGAVDDSIVTNGDAMDTDERPQKKQRGPDGDALVPMDDDELIDAQLEAEQAAAAEADEESDVEEDEVDVEEDEEVNDEALLPEPIHDEALDEPDSD